MSQERLGADANALCSNTDSKNPNDASHDRVLLQLVDDEMHKALDELGGDSVDKLRSMLVPAHLPIIIGSIIKARDD
jgi:hypothetical protein